jgi:GxxExxY protein
MIKGILNDEATGDHLTRAIIGYDFAVGNGLGTGFFEKVYENALANTLRKNGFTVDQQQAVDVRFEGEIVGTYVADLIVNKTIVVELKAVSALSPAHAAQCLNFLKASGLQTCLLLNFGTPSLQIRRLTKPA